VAKIKSFTVNHVIIYLLTYTLMSGSFLTVTWWCNYDYNSEFVCL